MQLMLEQATPTIVAALAAWLMVRAGVSKRMLTLQTPTRCPACGRRRTRGRCGCAFRG